MVYSGYPSKACTECRTRRTKCDTKKPSCSQCIRAHRECKGYRDLKDLVFRDESQGQLDKHRRRVEKSADPSRPKLETQKRKSLESKTVPEFITDSTTKAALPSQELHMSLDDQAIQYFFHNYVLDKKQFPRGGFQYLSEVYKEGPIGIGVSNSIAALGLAGMGHLYNSTELRTRAQLRYNIAVKQVRSQLINPETAKSDETLIAVILLSLYETNTCEGRQSMESWTNHITGAATLLDLRERRLVSSPIGYHLYHQVRAQVITNCIQRKAHVPSIIDGWSLVLDSESLEERASSELSELAVRFCNLRASMKGLRDPANPAHIISTACALDDAFADWERRCPLAYSHTVVWLENPVVEVFSDYYHVYPSIWLGTLWNNYRSIRILLNELILAQLYHHIAPRRIDSRTPDDNPDFFETQIRASNATLLQLSLDMCASVPYFLGYSAEGETKTLVPKAVQGNLLLWPLYTAACTEMAADKMRLWVAGRMEWIAEVMGIKQAGPLAHTLYVNQDLRDWQAGDMCT